MVDEQDRDHLELAQAKRALEEAKAATIEIDVVIASVQEANESIRSIVERNGYVDRFRTMLRGA